MPTSWMRKLLLVDGAGTDESTRIAVYKYFSLLIVLLLTFLLVRNVMRSRAGRGMIAIRDNQIGAAVSGVPLNKHKVLTFTPSALRSPASAVPWWRCRSTRSARPCSTSTTPSSR
ncbi:MAG: hypothetical protein R2755_02530 [Acidimicrobiales bacterium]